jgi:hypothetical protein
MRPGVEACRLPAVFGGLCRIIVTLSAGLESVNDDTGLTSSDKCAAAGPPPSICRRRVSLSGPGAARAAVLAAAAAPGCGFFMSQIGTAATKVAAGRSPT